MTARARMGAAWLFPRFFLVSFAFFLFGLRAGAQSPMFRGGIETVHVTVTVTDANGRLITDLAKDDFEVFEDGGRVPVTQFSDKRVPVSLGLLLDISDSMFGQPIVDAREAVDRFVGDLLEPGDEAFIASFNHMPRIVTTWTRPPSVAARRSTTRSWPRRRCSAAVSTHAPRLS